MPDVVRHKAGIAMKGISMTDLNTRLKVLKRLNKTFAMPEVPQSEMRSPSEDLNASAAVSEVKAAKSKTIEGQSDASTVHPRDPTMFHCNPNL